MRIRFILLAFLSLGTVAAAARTFRIDSQEQWSQWNFPTGVLILGEDGSVTPRDYRSNINAAADAGQFIYKDVKAQDVAGGIRLVSSNEIQGPLAIDGDAGTWWQPAADDAVDKWRIELDLGRLTQVKSIRLVFPDEEGARPFEQFAVLVSEGTRQVIGKDAFQFVQVGSTTLPNQDSVVEYSLSILEQGNAEGLYLATSSNDTLDYMNVQYIRLIALTKNADAALAEIEVTAVGDNVALGTIERGGNIRAGSNTQNINSIADGSASNWWSGRGIPVDWKQSGLWFEWDLGATFWVDQLTMFEPPWGFATTGFSNTQQIFFVWDTSDGTPVPTQGEETVQSPFDYQELSSVDNRPTSGLGRTRNFDLRFPPRKVRHLFYHHEVVFGALFRFNFHLFEIFLYGSGHPAEVVMESNFIDLGGVKSLRQLRWEADQFPGTSLEIRSRSGDELVEEVFYYDKNGQEIPEARWNKLPASQKLPLVTVLKPGSDWSTWSPIYQRSGEPFLSPTPRNFVQLQARLKTDDPQVAPSLLAIELEFDDPLVGSGVFAQVAPREARLDSLTQFSLRLGGVTSSGDSGFDQVRLVLPGPVQGPVQVRVGDGGFAEMGVETAGDTLLVPMPEQVRGDSVELMLPLRLVRNAASFNGWVTSSSQPLVRQEIQPVDKNALLVFVPEIAVGGNLIRRFEIDHPVISPNGDGINDQLQVQLLIVKILQEPNVDLFDMAGRLVRRLPTAADGTYRWDGRDGQGAVVAPGIYLLSVAVEADARTDRRQRLIHVAY
ncbi:MAG: hypothetical protein GKR89_10135 [Candidatus Latescibacteria bacterium]|nr:hypothetical protein [Candidatus Latescibacterota bacterium]